MKAEKTASWMEFAYQCQQGRTKATNDCSRSNFSCQLEANSPWNEEMDSVKALHHVPGRSFSVLQWRKKSRGKFLWLCQGEWKANSRKFIVCENSSHETSFEAIRNFSVWALFGMVQRFRRRGVWGSNSFPTRNRILGREDISWWLPAAKGFLCRFCSSLTNKED